MENFNIQVNQDKIYMLVGISTTEDMRNQMKNLIIELIQIRFLIGIIQIGLTKKDNTNELPSQEPEIAFAESDVEFEFDDLPF